MKTGHTRFSIELSEKRILVIGIKFIKVFSLETYQELRDIPSVDENYEAELTSDSKHLFVATDDGLKQFSLPDLSLLIVHEPSTIGYCLSILNRKESVLFSNGRKMERLDLRTSTVTNLKDRHNFGIFSIKSTSDEQAVYTTGDNSLKKWNTNSWSVDISIELENKGSTLNLNESSNSLLLGMRNGVFAEFSCDDLSLKRRFLLHHSRIYKIIRLPFEEVMSCSEDGNFYFPFTRRKPLKISESPIFSITQLSDKTISCSCREGLKIISPPPDFSFLSRLKSISSSIKSIRKSPSPSHQIQLVFLLQHHLAQSLRKIKQRKITGLSTSLLPGFRSVRKSHLFEGLSEGKIRIFAQNYFLEMVTHKTRTLDVRASLTFYDKKLKLLGSVTDERNPFKSFKIKEIKKGKWSFTMNEEVSFDSGRVYELATAYFLNGHLNCYIFEGDLTTRSGFQATLKINEVLKKVEIIRNDLIVVTEDGKMYFLNPSSKKIEEIFQLDLL